MDPFINPRAAMIAAQADKLVSKIHDSLWDFDGQPYDQKARPSWDLHRDEMNGLIWKLHELLRPVAAESLATKPEASPRPENQDLGDEQSSSSAEAGGMEWKLEPQLRKEGDWVSEPWRSAVLLTCRRCGGRTFEPFCPTCGAIIVPMWIPEGYTEPIPFVRSSTTTAEPSPSPESTEFVPAGEWPPGSPSRPVSTDEEEGRGDLGGDQRSPSGGETDA